MIKVKRAVTEEGELLLVGSSLAGPEALREIADEFNRFTLFTENRSTNAVKLVERKGETFFQLWGSLAVDWRKYMADKKFLTEGF